MESERAVERAEAQVIWTKGSDSLRAKGSDSLRTKGSDSLNKAPVGKRFSRSLTPSTPSRAQGTAFALSDLTRS